MMKALYLLLFVSSSALANDAALLKCRALGDIASRVACYDAIPAGAPAPVAAAPVAAAPATAPAARPAVAAAADQSFGVETIRGRTEPAKWIESTVVGDFEGWRLGSHITLANGQVWRVTGGSEAVLPRNSNQKVRIKRGVLGSMFLEVDGASNWANVRRVK